MTICGLDECGRGALAGPLVASGVIINIDTNELVRQSPVPIRDSKKLSPLQREKMSTFLTDQPLTYRIESITVAEINDYGIGWANLQVFERLITELEADYYIVDGNLKFPSTIGRTVKSIVKADNSFIQVMLASVVAKTYRDSLMKKLHPEFPYYYWQTNVGYGTKKHLEALRQYGPCLHHRLSFVRTALDHLS